MGIMAFCNDLEDAEAHFRETHKLSPEDEDYFHNLHLVLQKQNKTEDVKILFEEEMSREFSLEKLNAYDRLLRANFPEEWEKVQNALKMLTGEEPWTDIFVAWADLTLWHRKKFPAVASLLNVVARDQLYILQ